MNQVAVFIGTTGGPVQIERLIGETAPLSEVFIGRGIEPLTPFSEAYDNFLRPGRPVHKAFGPFPSQTFRLDVAHAITSGNSWELAVFTAHGLAKENRLTKSLEAADEVIWLTGRINADFDILPVKHVQEKLHQAKILFSTCKKKDIPVKVVVPLNEGDSSLNDIKDISLQRIENALQILEQYNIPHNIKAIPSCESTEGDVDIFISCEPQDRDFALQLCRSLQILALPCQVSPHNQQSEQQADTGVRSSRLVIVTLPESEKITPDLHREIELALSLGKDILTLKTYEGELKQDLPLLTKNSQFFTLSNKNGIEECVKAVLSKLKPPLPKGSQDNPSSQGITKNRQKNSSLFSKTISIGPFSIDIIFAVSLLTLLIITVPIMKHFDQLGEESTTDVSTLKKPTSPPKAPSPKGKKRNPPQAAKMEQVLVIFNNLEKAQGFADHLNSKSGVSCGVKGQDDGKFAVFITITDQSDGARKLELIKKTTGFIAPQL